MIRCVFVAAFAFLVALADDVDAQCGCTLSGLDVVSSRSAVGTVKVGDMLMEDGAKYQFFGIKKFRAASTYGPHKWPGNVVNFVIDRDVQQDAEAIRSALKSFQERVDNCVTFNEFPTAPTSGDYVLVFNGGEGACYSHIGRVGGKQRLSLGAGCTNSPATIQHEFMHALGFFHEQSRHDRDNYIWIDFNNTQTDFCNNYMKCQDCNTTTVYNVKSIMHYPSYGFGCNGVPTIFTRGDNQQIPYNHDIQDTDVQNVKWLYNCS